MSSRSWQPWRSRPTNTGRSAAAWPGVSEDAAMTEPIASRPHMPGYGLLEAAQGTGLLPWAWAVERLERSHDYWVATVRPDGRPHVMPVWGVWLQDAVRFSSSRGSRIARNLDANPNCPIATDNPDEQV